MTDNITYSSSVEIVTPGSIFEDGYELTNQTVIERQEYEGSFIPEVNTMEFYIYDANKNIIYSDYDFRGYYVEANSKPSSSFNVKTQQTEVKTNEVNLDPESDIAAQGFNNGMLYGVYNFINLELASSLSRPYYLAEISSDRTEIRLKSNLIPTREMKSSFVNLNQRIQDPNYFDEIYISFGDNDYHIGVNMKYDDSVADASTQETGNVKSGNAVGQSSILIKLYDPLPSKFNLLDELYVCTKTAETQAYLVNFVNDYSTNIVDNIITLRGPNSNLKINEFVNGASTFENKDSLLGTKSTGSKDQLLNRLAQKGVTLEVNYSTASFADYVNFSSAKSQVSNFVEKVSRIQAYEADIATITKTTGSNPGVPQISESLATLYTKIENEITAFSGFDYYQYYSTSSDAYPKTGSVFPLQLLATQSTSAQDWITLAEASASRYDEDNQNWLYYTIPDFIKNNTSNDNYLEFVNMIGQSFDELWMYTKAIAEKNNTTNQFDKGVPLQLADDVITSLGYTGYGNNYNNQDNFIGLIGNDNGSYVPPTGSELITQYIAVNGPGGVINYWSDFYSFAGYVESLENAGFPYPIDKVSKEIFKRLYHNMAYLVKKKGTVSGLRQLINIWGIPSTILRINEFGGKNKDEIDDYDLWYRRYSYAFKPVPVNTHYASASFRAPWQPLQRNYIADTEYIVPDGVGFRFKTTGYPSSSYAGLFNTQSLFVKKSITADTDVADFGIVLYYTGSVSGSGAGNTGPTYSGGSSSAYKDYGEMRFLLSGSVAGGGTAISPPIYLPFFDKGWWSVLLQRDTHPAATDNSQNTTYTLYCKNKIYDGADGNQIGFQGSASLTINASSGGSASLNYAWNRFVATNDVAGGYLGGWGSTMASGESGSIGTVTKNAADSNIAIGLSGKNFSGSFQEFRYYSHDISESVFNDFVMNPESIEGNFITGSESSFDIVNFRAPLGNELENLFTSSQTAGYTDVLTSVHPAITGSSPLTVTASFVNPGNSTVTSSYDIIYNTNTARRTYSEINRETYFLDQPSIGIRNRISNKIKYSTNLNFGNVLSNQVSIQQDPPISQSYTDNINLLEVAFSPTDEVNDDIIQSLGYGAIQEVIADPRFRSQSDDNYPGLQAIAKDYFKKYYNSNTFDYLRLIKYFDDSLFRAIKNYVPARTSVSTGIVIKQNMLERSRYREPQVDIVTTQSYAPFNQALTAKNLELTGSVNTNQLWDHVNQTTFYSASDPYTFSGGAGGSVNTYNTISEGGAFFITEQDNQTLTAAAKEVSLLEASPTTETSNDIVLVDSGFDEGTATAQLIFTATGGGNATGDANFKISIEDYTGTTVNYAAVTNAALQDQIDNGFTCFLATGNAQAKALAFVQAVNSANGQGTLGTGTIVTSISTTTLTDDTVTLTQGVPGTSGNTVSPGIGISIGTLVALGSSGTFSNGGFGTSRFEKVFLNAFKSVQTPLYVDYLFTGAPTSANITVRASSSVRGVVMTNTTNYTVQDPAGAILENSLFDIHPGEDMYILASSDETVTINSLTLALGENTTYIPDNDTPPQSQQGYFTFTTTSLGIDTAWDPYQEQFYNGEYSGSEVTVEARTPYNPYRKVKPNSTNFNNIINDNTRTYVSQSSPSDNGTVLTLSIVSGGSGYSSGGPATTTFLSGPSADLGITPTGCTVGVTAPVFVVTAVSVVAAGTNYLVGDILQIDSGDSNATVQVTSIIPFSNITAQGFDFDNSSFGVDLKLSNLFSQSIISYQNYELTFDITTTAGASQAGISQFNTFNDSNGVTRSKRNGIGFLNPTITGTVTGGATLTAADAIIIGIDGTGTAAITASFEGLNFTPIDGVNPNEYLGAMFKANAGMVGTVSNLQLKGIGGIYDDPRAPIFLTQQDEGYNNQADYQNMSNVDAQGNTISPIFLVENTQSVIFANSEYNPLSNNVDINRSSSYRYILSYGATQSCPNNFDLVVTQSYFPTSPSGTFPELADVPDSNYTMPSSVNARYAGTKIKSLDYNFFTPSGSVGPEIELPIMPVNRSRNPVGFRVANEFIDGSVTSSFEQTTEGAGSASWAGDDPVPSGSSAIDKHPMFMARFENSYEQLNFYNSYQFNIDQLIEVPMEDISGQALTPNAITIDGSNQNKKFVSSVFEPKRKAQISYLNPKTRDIDYTTMQISNYDILGGSVEFLTVNTNATSRVSGSLLYNYTKGGQLVTSSLTQDQATIQMVTGSNIVGDPATEGRLNTATTLAFVSAFNQTTQTSIGTSFPIATNLADGIYTFPLSSIGGPGSGGQIKIVVLGGEIKASSGGVDSGDVAASGVGYIVGQNVQITFSNSPTSKFPIFVLTFQIQSSNLLANPNSVNSKGFLLSGSVTTGDIPETRNSSLILGESLSFTGGAGGTQNAGTITNIPTLNYSITNGVRTRIAQGSGLTVDITSDGTSATTVSVNQGGSGYRPGDQVIISAAALNSRSVQGGTTNPVFTGAGGIVVSAFIESDFEGSSSPFRLNFNPSPISSSFVTASLGDGEETVPLNQQLLIGGPQLALFHMYNTTVSSSLYQTNPVPSDLNKGPTTALWTVSGSNPADVENYYNFSPEFSGCGSYTNTNTPYLIERGDIIRVEATLNTIEAGISQSTNIIKDFTVEEVENFTYTSSFSAANNFSNFKTTALTGAGGQITVDSQGGASSDATYTGIGAQFGTGYTVQRQIGGVYTTIDTAIGAVFTIISSGGAFTSMQATTPGVGYEAGDKIIFATGGIYSASPAWTIFLNASAFDSTIFGEVRTLGFQAAYNGAFANTKTKGTITPSALNDGAVREFSYEINSVQGSQMLVLLSNTTGSVTNVGGTVTAQIKCTIANGVDEWIFTGGTNIPEGTRFEIAAADVQDGTTGWGDVSATAFQFQMINGCIIQIPNSNNFTIGVDVGGTAESGSQSGYHDYEKGEVGFTAPTFIRVFPDPEVELNGLSGGEVTKMTIRRQIEADDKVMLKNVPPPSGSKGIETISGQGFLIPNDFSPQQKLNALNIINQLKGINAFDKPNEPGITGGDFTVNPGGGQGSPGGGGVGGGLGGIQ